MNKNELSNIINNLYATTDHIIDSITLTPVDVIFDMLTENSQGDIVTDTLIISCNGTITMNGYLWDVEELNKLPEVVRMVIRKFITALRDEEVFMVITLSLNSSATTENCSSHLRKRLYRLDSCALPESSMSTTCQLNN